MSKRRRRPAPLGARIAALVAALALAALLIFLMSRLITGAVSSVNLKGGGSPDPQFAEPAETVTRPPELMGEGEYPALEDDPSASWDMGEQTPVDKTAEELSREESGQ